jgi:hypothetical protein
MRLSLKSRREAETADQSAVTPPTERPSARERGAMRRRVRQLRRRREAMLLELGALAFEMHRQGRREPELLERKSEEIRAIDDEERGLSAALQDDSRLVELVATGITGACPACGTLVGTDARYCQSCGTPVGDGAV